MLLIRHTIPPSPPAGYGNAPTGDPSCYVNIHFIFCDSDSMPFKCQVEPLLQIPKYHLFSFQLPNQNWLPLLRYICYTITSSVGTLAWDSDPEEATGNSSSSHYKVVADDEISLVALHNVDANLVYICTTPTSLVDPDLAAGAVTTESESEFESGDAQDFADELASRDGNHCLFTHRHRDFCRGAHIIPNTQGDEYMRALIKQRGGGSGDKIDGVDDVRNGLLLNSELRISIRLGWLAIIKTPTAGGILKTSDLHQDVDESESLYTLLYMGSNVYNPEDQLRQIIGDPNLRTAVPRPNDSENPPDFLFDAAYGARCLATWGPERSVVEDVFDRWRAVYYGEGVDWREEKAKKKEEARRARQQRQEEYYASREKCKTRAGQDSDDGIPTREEVENMNRMDLIYCLLACNAFVPPPPRSSSHPRSTQVDKKVEQWRQGMEDVDRENDG